MSSSRTSRYRCSTWTRPIRSATIGLASNGWRRCLACARSCLAMVMPGTSASSGGEWRRTSLTWTPSNSASRSATRDWRTARSGYAPPTRSKCVTWTSGGGPGLQAGEESGSSRSGAAEPAGGTRGAPPDLLRLFVRYCKGEDGLPVPGIPRRGAAADAEPHLRLRPRGVEPDPGRPARPLAAGAEEHLLRSDRRRADPPEEGPGPGVPPRGLLGAAPADAAPPAQGVHRVLRQAGPPPAVQVPARPADGPL